jgi:hypothetical protein
VPDHFVSIDGEDVPIVARPDLDLPEAESIVEAVATIPWAELCHAYGSAADVGAQLAALVVGDDPTRHAAWGDLWGNIHHQGTIYSATVPATPILATLATWSNFPDRVDVLFFIREVARAEGVVVWRYGPNGEIVHDEEAQRRLTAELHTAVDRIIEQLLGSWTDAPTDVRRGLVYLLTARPDLRDKYGELLDSELPVQLRDAWEEAASSPFIMSDEVVRLEEWAGGETL